MASRKNKKQLHQIRIQQRSKRPEVSTPPGKTTQPAQTPPLDQRPVEERSVQLALEMQEEVKAIIKHQHASDAAAGHPLTDFGRSDVDRDDFVEGLEFLEADSTLPPAAERPVPRPVAQRTTSSLSPTPPAPTTFRSQREALSRISNPCDPAIQRALDALDLSLELLIDEHMALRARKAANPNYLMTRRDTSLMREVNRIAIFRLRLMEQAAAREERAQRRLDEREKAKAALATQTKAPGNPDTDQELEVESLEAIDPDRMGRVEEINADDGHEFVCDVDSTDDRRTAINDDRLAVHH